MVIRTFGLWYLGHWKHYFVTFGFFIFSNLTRLLWKIWRKKQRFSWFIFKVFIKLWYFKSFFVLETLHHKIVDLWNFCEIKWKRFLRLQPFTITIHNYETLVSITAASLQPSKFGLILKMLKIHYYLFLVSKKRMECI